MGPHDLIRPAKAPEDFGLVFTARFKKDDVRLFLLNELRATRIPTRRLNAFLCEALYRGAQMIVAEADGKASTAEAPAAPPAAEATFGKATETTFVPESLPNDAGQAAQTRTAVADSLPQLQPLSGDAGASRSLVVPLLPAGYSPVAQSHFKSFGGG